MSRQAFFASSRGRSPLLPSLVRLTRSVMANLDAIENIPSAIERSPETSMRPEPHGRAVLTRANRTQRKTIDSGTENESSDDEVADDEEDEDSDEDDDGDDESDQPAAFAPSRGHQKPTFRKAGHLSEYRRMFHSEDPVLYEDPHDLFGGLIEGDDDDDDDDEFYRAVDDISDEDEQNDEMFEVTGADAGAVASLFREKSDSPFSLPDPEQEADFILDQVDGLSAYGFGDDLDTGDGSGEFSAPSEDGDITALPERHVHFGPDVEQMNPYGRYTSPSLTRALLPSAMLFANENHSYELDTSHQTSKHSASAVVEEAYDSDATEVLSPPPTPLQSSSSATHLATTDAEHTSRTTADSALFQKQNGKRPPRRRKRPPRGIFTVDQDRSWAVLDPSGKKVLQIPAANTNRHAWLDEMSQSTSTPSSSESPLNPSLKLHHNGVSESGTSVANVELVINTAIPDVMIAGLSGRNSFAESEHGQAVGPPEAFYSNGLQLVGGDYAISPEPESDAYDEEMTPVTKKSGFPLQEFLEDLGDDDSEDGDAELPLYAPADENLTSDNDGLFGHLNNMNVTAFRRSADPMSASRPGTSYSYHLQTSPTAGSPFALPAVPIRTPKTSHKRKVSSTPYQDEKIYGDVTPVERKVIHGTKRRKMAT